MAAAAESRNFVNHTKTQEEEDAYDYVKDRKAIVPTSFVGSVAHMIKGALGGGILAAPVAYKFAGILLAIPLNIIFGIFMCYCLHHLVKCKQILMRRTRNHSLSYADCGEAAAMTFPKKGVRKFASAFRYMIDASVCIDLFGSCCSYQIVVAKSLKQLVENTQDTTIAGKDGLPSLRIYLLIMIPLYVLICMIRHLKYLAPFSHAANGVVVAALGMVVYYCVQNNPSLSGMQLTTTFEGTLRFIGMNVFSMSCSGIVVPIEGSMKDPSKFKYALVIGHAFIICLIASTAFFGYAAFTDKIEAPVTINFPMTTVPKLFKVSICLMLYVTHGLNFWAPFNLCWYYIKKRYPQERIVFWELVWRGIIVVIIGIIGAIFPTIEAIMGLIGCFCLANMSIVFPSIISILVYYERPGFGKLYWRLWRSLFFIIVGLFIFVCGTIVNFKALISIFSE